MRWISAVLKLFWALVAGSPQHAHELACRNPCSSGDHADVLTGCVRCEDRDGRADRCIGEGVEGIGEGVEGVGGG